MTFFDFRRTQQNKIMSNWVWVYFVVTIVLTATVLLARFMADHPLASRARKLVRQQVGRELSHSVESAAESRPSSGSQKRR